MSSLALGASLYSAGCICMFDSHFLLELAVIKWLWPAAFLAFDQRGANCFNIGLTSLVATDQVANIFTVIGELPSGDLRLDPVVLLVGNGDRFARCTHRNSLQ